MTRMARSTAPAFALLALLLLSGCTRLQYGLLLGPSYHGLERLAPSVYADPELSSSQKAQLLRAAAVARRRVAAFYGGLLAKPTIVACASDDCYQLFGGIRGRAVSLRSHMLLSPRALNATTISHELAHLEFAARLGPVPAWPVPPWFSEGLAVLISQDPEFTREKWLAATARGSRAPALSALATRSGWLRVTGPGSHGKQLSYGTSKQEVARWHAWVGLEGLRQLIAALRAGEPFEQAYPRLEQAWEEEPSASRS
ncbi:hypothetical protein RG903_01695 [Thermithiobacillus tepidarius DSM 3134]|uniref:hypothetical protein n=1 Tax=Thermithiobacillus tepidarius TaxID=929 RepID=UPI0012DFC62E|nr:hypothetical protein [Thermithiobacillus tepidarius]